VAVGGEEQVAPLAPLQHRGAGGEDGRVVQGRDVLALPRVIHPPTVIQAGPAPLGHDCVQGGALVIVGGAAGDQDVLVAAGAEMVVPAAADQQVAAGAADQFVVAAAADEDVVPLAARHAPDAAEGGHVGGDARPQVDVHVGGVGGVAQPRVARAVD